MLNCSAIDDFFDGGDTASETTLGRVAAIALPAATIVVSLTLLFFGRRVVRSMTLVLGGSVSCVLMYHTTASASCDGRLVLSLVALFCGALASHCVITRAIFLSGGAGFGACAHAVYALARSGDMHRVPIGEDWVYVSCVAGAAIVGGGVVHFEREKTLVLLTASLGGAGTVVGISLLVSDVSSWIWLLAASALALVGITTQMRSSLFGKSALKRSDSVPRNGQLR